MSPPPFLPTYISTVNKRRQRQREKKMDRFFPSLCTNCCPDYPSCPNSCITPAASQQGLHRLLCHHRIVHSLALPFCPFHWAGAPSSNSRRKEEVGMGTGVCQAPARPDPTIQWEATKYTDSRGRLVKSAELGPWTHSGRQWGWGVEGPMGRLERAFALESEVDLESQLYHTQYDVSLGNYLNVWAWRTSLS